MPNNIKRSEYEVIPGENYPNRLEADQSNQSKTTFKLNFFKSLFNTEVQNQNVNNAPVKEEPIAETSKILKSN